MTLDQHPDTCLKAGDRIKDSDGGHYLIDSVHAEGATCIVYKGHTEDGLPVYIKELYPQSANLARNADGSLASENNDTFEQVRTRFERAHLMQREFYLSEETRNVTSTPTKLLKANNTDYIVMPIDWGSTLHEQMNGNLLTIKELLEVLISLATTLAYYHQKGYLHLDIKPENIFVPPETKQLAKLFDFDTVVHQEDLRSGAVQLSYSEGFTAPEQKRRQVMLIDQRADFFAIGAILFHYVMGVSPTAQENGQYYLSDFFEYEVDANQPLFNNLDPKLAKEIRKFFGKTIQNAPAARYQTDEDLLRALKELCALAEPLRIFLQPTFRKYEGFFVGRDAELAQIASALKLSHCTVLRGIGGMGKSTLARKYAELHQAEYDTILFAPYQGSLKEMITSDALVPLHGVSAQSFADNAAGYYPYKLKKLRDLATPRTLFIIDGLDTLDDEDLFDVLQLNCTFLLTSRCDFKALENDMQQVELDKLSSPEDAYALFAHHYNRPISDALKAQVLQVIEKIDRHTITLELLAKSLSKTDSHHAAEIIDQFEQDDAFVFASERIRQTKDGKLLCAPAQEIIQKIFDISALSQSEQDILMHLSLMPPITGIDRVFFKELYHLATYDDLTGLIEKGWLSETNDAVAMHQVISDTLLKAFAPTAEKCNGFLCETCTQVSFLCEERPAYRYLQYWLPILSRLEQVLTPTFCENDPLHALLYHTIGYLHHGLASYDLALSYHLKALVCRQAIPLVTRPDYAELADMHLALGHTQLALQLPHDALASYQEALNLQCSAFLVIEPIVGKTKAYISAAHLKLGNLAQAEQFAQDSLQCLVFDVDASSIVPQAKPNDQLGQLYIETGLAQESLRRFEMRAYAKCIAAQQTEQAAIHLAHAESHETQKKTEFEKAITHLNLAREVYLAKNLPERIHLIQVSFALAKAYMHLHCTPESISFAEKAFDDCMLYFDIEHPIQIESSLILGQANFYANELFEADTWFSMACNLLKKGNHLDPTALAETYRMLAHTYLQASKTPLEDLPPNKQEHLSFLVLPEYTVHAADATEALTHATPGAENLYLIYYYARQALQASLSASPNEFILLEDYDLLREICQAIYDKNGLTEFATLAADYQEKANALFAVLLGKQTYTD